MRARSLVVSLSFAAAVYAASMTASLAQGLDAEGAIDTIVGTDVGEEAARAEADPERVIKAIAKSAESVDAVRKTIALDKLDIVFVADAAATEGGPPAAVSEALSDHREDVAALRKELEGNAMLYHAVNSRQVLMRDVLAVEFDGERHVTIFVAAPEPSGTN